MKIVDCDSNDDIEDSDFMSKTTYKHLQASYNCLEKEKEKVVNELESLKKEMTDLKNQHDEECKEIAALRSLNRELQEKILELPITLGKFHKGSFYF